MGKYLKYLISMQLYKSLINGESFSKSNKQTKGMAFTMYVFDKILDCPPKSMNCFTPYRVQRNHIFEL